MSALIRVGHKGAAALAPPNTLASFDAALAAGVDMIEFDVLVVPGRSKTLYVAHDVGALDPLNPLTLGAALEHLSTPAFAGIRLQLDLKSHGSEQRVLDELQRSAAVARAFISTARRHVLERVRMLEPTLELGWTVPGIPGVVGTPLITPTLGRIYRSLLPRRAGALIARGAIDALVPHWSMVSRELVEAVRGAGGELYAWTVDDAGEIARLEQLGVTGVITNDPRLFA